ncbi:MAG: WD40 repeat domain-containing protein [Isosphaeraceae bacterium]
MSEDGKVKVWEVAAGRLATSPELPDERWKDVTFSPDGSVLAAAGSDHGLVLWNVATWTIRHRIREQDRLGAEALAFTPDGRHLALSLGFAARIYVVVRAEEYARLAGVQERPAGGPHPEIPPMVLRSQQAFWRDLPGLVMNRRNLR